MCSDVQELWGSGWKLEPCLLSGLVLVLGHACQGLVMGEHAHAGPKRLHRDVTSQHMHVLVLARAHASACRTSGVAEPCMA